MSKPATSSPLWAIANGANRGSYEIIKGLKFFVAGAVVASRQLAVGLYKTPEAIRATHLGMKLSDPDLSAADIMGILLVG